MEFDYELLPFMQQHSYMVGMYSRAKGRAASCRWHPQQLEDFLSLSVCILKSNLICFVNSRPFIFHLRR